MTATDHALELVAVAAQAAHDKKADQVLAFDVSEQLAITDAFVLASANNERAVGAIVDEVEDKLREVGAKPIRREGHKEGRWVLLDYGEIVDPRAARGGAVLLRPRAPLERLPAHPADPHVRRLVLLRHGRTEWNDIGRAQGHADVPLDETGEAQAKAVAPVLAALRHRSGCGPPTSPGPPARPLARRRRRPGSSWSSTPACASSTSGRTASG